MARTTRQRAAVRAVFQDLDGFHSAQEVHARLRDAGDPVGLSTVYRAVQSLADDGELDSIRTDTGEALYRRCSPQHHHHLVCRGCGLHRRGGRARPSSSGPTGSPASTASPTSATRWRSSAPAPPAGAVRQTRTQMKSQTVPSGST